MNGDSEQKKDDIEVEEKPKSPAQEENNDDNASSPNRWISHMKQYAVSLLCLFVAQASEWKYILMNRNDMNII